MAEIVSTVNAGRLGRALLLALGPGVLMAAVARLRLQRWQWTVWLRLAHSLPSITRKTDKGLPRYDDAQESDTFILSGAEDLVPEFAKDAQGNFIQDKNGRFTYADTPRAVDGVDYLVRHYCRSGFN